MLENKIHKDREEIMRFYKRHNKVYVYGAGYVAGFMMEYLKEEDFPVAGVIVSDGNRKNDELKGCKIFEISEVKFEHGDGVILGVGAGLQKEIVKLLTDRGLDEEQIYCQDVYVTKTDRVIAYDSLITGKLEDDVSSDGFFADYKDLEEIGSRYDTDKCSKFHNYLNKYEYFLKDWKYKSFNLLELGVFNGASLKMWEEFFPNAYVYGVDINEDCKKIEQNRRKVIIKDLSVSSNLEELKKITPSVIIDDASHIWSHQIKALFCLFPCLPSGGVFIMEDLETSFSAYRDFTYDDSCISTYEVCSKLAELVCSHEIIKKNNVSATIWELKDEIESMAMQIEMISFIHGSCIIIKK
jgi:hypothetical protein